MSQASRTRTVAVTNAWASLPAIKSSRVSLLNNTGAALDVRHSGQQGAGEQITLKDGQSVSLSVVAKASEVQIKAAAGANGVQVIIDG